MRNNNKKMTVSPVFSRRNFTVIPENSFVIMPFGAPWSNRIYQQIKHVAEEFGFNVYRADDIFSPTSIIEDIWESINSSSVVIADVTGANPNVYYELGIAHTIGKPVILLTQEISPIPFDTLGIRHIKYEDNVDGCNLLRISLQKFLQQYAPTKKYAKNISINGKIERERYFIDVCNHLLNNPIKEKVIRTHAGLGILAVPDIDIYDNPVLHKLRLERKKLFLQLLKSGFFLKSILNIDASHHLIKGYKKEQILMMFDALLSVIKESDPEHLLILNSQYPMMESRKTFGDYCYAYSRKDFMSGKVYSITEFIYDAEQIRQSIALFENYFEQARHENGGIQNVVDIKEVAQLKIRNAIESLARGT
ncbi:MAG: hypothetical protein V9G98_25935 [Candidatus Competibacter sp.]